MNIPQHVPPRSPADLARIAADREKQAQAIAEKRHQLARAYAEVFGWDDATRTPAQRAVWKNLEEVCCKRQTTVLREQGPVDPMMTHILEGRRQIGLHIENLIEDAAKEPPTA